MQSRGSRKVGELGRMSRSLHMRRPPLTIGRETGNAGVGNRAAGYAAYDDDEGYDEYDGDRVGAHGGGTRSHPRRELSGADRQATRLAELQARFAELRAKAESEAMEELLSGTGGGVGGDSAWEPMDKEQRGFNSRRRYEGDSRAPTRAVTAEPQRRVEARQNRAGNAPKPSAGSASTSNVAWLEKIKREVDSARDAADVEAWYPEPVDSESMSQSTRHTERSALRTAERRYGGLSSRDRGMRRASSPPRQASRQYVIRHKISSGSGPNHLASSREEAVKLAARVRAQQAFGAVDFAETRSTHKLLQGQLAQSRQEQALQDRRRQRTSPSRRAVSAPRARSVGQRRAVHFETVSPPRGSARDDTRGKFGVESTGREPPLRNSSRVRSTRRAVSAPRERRTKEPAVKQPWRSAAPAKGKEDPFELAGKFASHKEKVQRTNYSKAEASGALEVEVSVEISAELSARVERCGVEPAKIAALKQKLKAHSYGQTGQNPNKLFKHFDRDNTGALEFDEFKAAVRKVGHMTYHQMSDKELHKLFKGLDADDSGAVGIEELTAFVWGMASGTAARTLTAAPKTTVPEADPPPQGQHVRSYGQASALSVNAPHDRTAANDALQMAAALSQAATAPGSPAQEPMSVAEWHRQQLEDAAAYGYVPSHMVDRSNDAWSTSLRQQPSSYGTSSPEEDSGVTYIQATGYAQHPGGLAEDSGGAHDQTSYIGSSGAPCGSMRVAAPRSEPEPEQEQAAVGYGPAERQQRFVKNGGGRHGVSMRDLRRHIGIDSKGRPPAKKVALQETAVIEAASSTAGGRPQMANPPPRQPKPTIDRISTRSVRLRWTGDHGQDQGKLQFFLYRSSYRNTGERVPGSVVEIECGQVRDLRIDAMLDSTRNARAHEPSKP